MRIPVLIAALLACPLPGVAGGVNEFVPGEPMVFPMRSRGVPEQLVRALQVNCRSVDPGIAASCEQALQRRGSSCAAVAPDVFADREQYTQWAGRFGKCLLPRPICAGVEVSTMAECRAQQERP